MNFISIIEKHRPCGWNSPARVCVDCLFWRSPSQAPYGVHWRAPKWRPTWTPSRSLLSTGTWRNWSVLGLSLWWVSQCAGKRDLLGRNQKSCHNWVLCFQFWYRFWYQNNLVPNFCNLPVAGTKNLVSEIWNLTLKFHNLVCDNWMLPVCEVGVVKKQVCEKWIILVNTGQLLNSTGTGLRHDKTQDILVQKWKNRINRRRRLWPMCTPYRIGCVGGSGYSGNEDDRTLRANERTQVKTPVCYWSTIKPWTTTITGSPQIRNQVATTTKYYQASSPGPCWTSVDHTKQRNTHSYRWDNIFTVPVSLSLRGQRKQRQPTRPPVLTKLKPKLCSLDRRGQRRQQNAKFLLHLLLPPPQTRLGPPSRCCIIALPNRVPINNTHSLTQ